MHNLTLEAPAVIYRAGIRPGSDTSIVQPGSDSGILALLLTNRDAPCFVVCPRHCGEEELLAAVRERCVDAVDLIFFSVNDRGDLLNSSDRAIQPEIVPQGTIVLVTHLPWLDDLAAKRFSHTLDTLRAKGLYTLIFLRPQNDRYQDLQPDRLLISGQMLLTEGWPSAGSALPCLQSFLTDFLPLEIRLLAALGMVLGHTNLEELATLGYRFHDDLPRLLVSFNPLFDLCPTNGQLLCHDLAFERLATELLALFVEHLRHLDVARAETEALACLTRLSMRLTQRGELERSHRVLALIEAQIETVTGQMGHHDTCVVTAVAEVGEEAGATGILETSATKAAPVSREARRGQPAIQPGETAPVLVSCRKSPSLYIRLFGDLQLSIGSAPLMSAHLNRNKVRLLLSYMVFNQRRGVLREQLVNRLWPNLDFDRGLKNLYTTWSLLGKALGSDNPKNCRYIERRGQLYLLNLEFVDCDVYRFEQLARLVLFGDLSLDEQQQAAQEMETLYAGQLMADTSADGFLRDRQQHFKNLMVDSLLLITRALRDGHHQPQALYFARAAYEIDDSREDVYRELMDVQYESGQRTSAMQTYFSCKRYLSEELGILPARSTTALYQDLLLDNC
ncbi:MAG: hypothetical protein LBU07_00770 [Coriobacteriales bacterium]|jgi:DNA-binding SARP family transcriptional activator|nr:hypothetical protein [Coriobacteriales bacterium]